MGCDNIGLAAACVPYWAEVEHEWQKSSMSLDMLGQNMASLAKRRQYSGPRWERWILVSMDERSEEGTMAQVDYKKMPSATLSSSWKCQNA